MPTGLLLAQEVLMHKTTFKPLLDLFASFKGINKDNWKDVLRNAGTQAESLKTIAAQKLGIETNNLSFGKNEEHIEKIFFDAKVVGYNGLSIVVPIETNFLYCTRSEEVPDSLLLMASVSDPSTGLLEEEAVLIAQLKNMTFTDLAESVKKVSGS